MMPILPESFQLSTNSKTIGLKMGSEIEASALSKDVKTTIINQLNELLKLAKEDRSALLRIGAGKSFFYNTVCLLLDNTHLEILRSVFNIGKTDDNIFPLNEDNDYRL